MLHSNEKIIKHKVGLLNPAEESGNVAEACRITGLSGDTFYCYKSAVDEGGVEYLPDKDKKKPDKKTGLGSGLKLRRLLMRLSNRHTGRFGPVMNSEREEFLFLQAGFAVSGCGMI